MNNASSRRQQFSLEQAVNAAPSLAVLQERVRTSQRCMACIAPLMPSALRAHVKAGPIDESGWCLLVGNAAASTKLRQLLPSFLQVLSQSGLQVSAIRIKVQAAPR